MVILFLMSQYKVKDNMLQKVIFMFPGVALIILGLLVVYLFYYMFIYFTINLPRCEQACKGNHVSKCSKNVVHCTELPSNVKAIQIK